MSNHLWLQYPWGNCKFAVVDPIRLQCKFAVVDPIGGWINDNLVGCLTFVSPKGVSVMVFVIICFA
jgi:hypothetical protein